jgi:hypothetical protein
VSGRGGLGVAPHDTLACMRQQQQAMAACSTYHSHLVTCC